jgi:AsmA protein
MKSALKWLALVAAALIVVIFGALLALPYFIDANRYKPEFEQYVQNAIGRPLKVTGEVHLSLFPWAGVSFSDLWLGNPPAFAERDFLTIKSFDVRVKLWPLLSRQVEVDRVVVSEPRLSLVTNKDGSVSWDFGAKPTQTQPSHPNDAESKTGPPIESLLVGEVSVQNGSILMVDHAKASRHEIAGLNVSLRDLSFDRPVRLTLSAAVNQKPLSAEGRFGPIGKNLGQDPVPLELTAEAFGQLKLKVKGNAENLLAAPSAHIELEVAEFSPRGLLAEIGQPPPPTTDLKVLQRMSLKARVTADAKTVAVSDAVLALDDSTLNLTAKATELIKPNIAFDFHLDHLNVDRYLPPKPAASAGPPSTGRTAGMPPPKSDYAPLRQLVLNGNATIGKLTAAHATAEEVNLKITARDGILALDPFALKLYQGTAVGKSAVNLKGESPEAEVQVNLDQVQINPLLKDLAGKDFLEGTTQGRITLSGRGEDPARIKRSLNGKGSFTLNDGAIVGVDLANMVRNVKAAFGAEIKAGSKPRTDFSGLIVPFTIENGVFHTPETSLKSPLLRLLAAGRADLVQETLDFRVDPKLVGTIKGQGDKKERAGIGVPIIVSGTFDRPNFRPDLEAMAKSKLDQVLGPSEKGSTPVKEKASDFIKGILPGKK